MEKPWSHTWALYLLLLPEKNNIYIALQTPLKKSGAVLDRIAARTIQWVLTQIIISQHLIILSKWKVTNVSPFVYKNIFLGFEINETTNLYIHFVFFFCKIMTDLLHVEKWEWFLIYIVHWLHFFSLFVCPRGNLFQINGLAY